MMMLNQPIAPKRISQPKQPTQFSGWFGKTKASFSPTEAKGIATEMVSHLPDAVKTDLSKTGVSLDAETVAIQLAKGVMQPFPGQEFRFGVIQKNGQIRSNDPIFQKIGQYLLKRIPADLIPEDGLPVVLRERGKDTHPAMAKFLHEMVIPYFQVAQTLPVLNPKNKPNKSEIEVFQTIPWPFFKAVASNQPLNSDYQFMAQAMDELPLYHLGAPIAPAAEAKLQEAFLPLKQRLSAIESATMQYSDQVHLKEVLLSMMAGASVGVTGELATQHFLEGHGPAAAAARTGTLVLVDMVDGFLGEMGVLQGDLQASGLSLNRDAIYGKNQDGSKKSMWQILKNPFKWDGPAKLFLKRASNSAVKGALLGSVLSAPAGIVLSDPTATLASRSLVGGVGTLGTATSIPFNIRATLPQVYLATMTLIEQGKIPVPAEIKKDEKQLRKYAMRIAEQDLLSRLGFAASMKAYTLTPLSGLILFSETFGVPREVAQTIYMGLAPAMENLVRLMLTVGRLKMTNPANMARAERLVLDSADRTFTPKEDAKLERLFVDRMTRSVAWTLTHVPWPVKLPQLDTSKLEKK
jgi:hypothetical protein